jgi:hypothetical protein
LEMVQYSCNPPQEGIPQPGVVVCKPVVRLFRRFVNSKLLFLPVSHTDSSQMRRWLDGRNNLMGTNPTSERRREACARDS